MKAKPDPSPKKSGPAHLYIHTQNFNALLM
jgi:hypothetical protein